MADLPNPALWHDSETGHWSRLPRPSRPTYEAYYTANQLRTYAAAQVAEAVAAERAKWVAEAAEFEQALSRVSQTIDRVGANVESAIRATEAPAARSET